MNSCLQPCAVLSLQPFIRTCHFPITCQVLSFFNSCHCTSTWSAMTRLRFVQAYSISSKHCRSRLSQPSYLTHTLTQSTYAYVFSNMHSHPLFRCQIHEKSEMGIMSLKSKSSRKQANSRKWDEHWSKVSIQISLVGYLTLRHNDRDFSSISYPRVWSVMPVTMLKYLHPLSSCYVILLHQTNQRHRAVLIKHCIFLNNLSNTAWDNFMLQVQHPDALHQRMIIGTPQQAHTWRPQDP